ncbi:MULTISPECIES: transglycosylase SLT domain-containing protein [unclassified Vibrio]|uniref:Transglycosylase SLT domain-containing protein n=1 Tax=Vibrio sp. HB236076 TaxID=3232307 RepID=A0AB39HED1_9VIBR|nr:transglycosylase SLT domain-containing protein [Vibrio sp. HB161653]MDP5254626.1 transglycosylase SLT domain-containing protein [Vibrio sp. HB161653]
MNSNFSGRYWSLTLGMSAVLSAVPLVVSAQSSDELERQRRLYQQAQTLLDQSSYRAYEQLRTSLDDYPLTPYLDYRFFISDLKNKSAQDVQDFVNRYRALPFSANIKARYLNVKYQQQDWASITQLYDTPPRGQQYQCIYYTAKWKQGQQSEAFAGAKKLWHSGQSVSGYCDGLFSAWHSAGQRSEQDVLERLVLTFESRNLSLMTYLAKRLTSQKEQAWSSQVIELYRHPERLTTLAKAIASHAQGERILISHLYRYARIDDDKAYQQLTWLEKAKLINLKSRKKLANYIAGRLLDDDGELNQWRDNTIAASGDDALVERRFRVAATKESWSAMRDWIDKLSDEAQQTTKWRYWLGRTQMALGETDKGKQTLSSVLGRRNFYSVAAADALNVTPKISGSTLTYQPQLIEKYHTVLTRIEELIDVDKINAAKGEWYWLLSRANADEKAMLAGYAGEQHWHHLSVFASIQAKLWDNMQLRFPVAHQWWFDFYSKRNQLNPITLMALARQESALDVTARSPVGARGLMQIMPATARHTAEAFELDYQNSDQLFEVQKNIEIGSHYFKELMDQYDNNRIFSLAAYNAGPSRVTRWVKRTDGKVDAYRFIESIPFRETRGYVQNILMFELYYRDRLNQPGPFLTAQEQKARY